MDLVTEDSLIDILEYVEPFHVYTVVSLLSYRFYLISRNTILWKYYCRTNFNGLYNEKEFTPKKFFEWKGVYSLEDEVSPINKKLISMEKKIFYEDRSFLVCSYKLNDLLQYVVTWIKKHPGKTCTIISERTSEIRALIVLKDQFIKRGNIELIQYNEISTGNGCKICFNPIDYGEILHDMLPTIHTFIVDDIESLKDSESLTKKNINKNAVLFFNRCATNDYVSHCMDFSFSEIDSIESIGHLFGSLRRDIY